MYSQTGKEEKAQELDEICTRIKSDFNKYLVKDGVVAGYGLVEKDGSISVLLHPSDTTTGIHYSLLPMDQSVSAVCPVITSGIGIPLSGELTGPTGM